MMREYQVRIYERLGVKFPGPTRHSLPIQSAPVLANVCYALNSDQIADMPRMTLCATSRHRARGSTTGRQLRRPPIVTHLLKLSHRTARSELRAAGQGFP